MDVVFPLGNGSIWENNEIRYSVRSVLKNFKDCGRIFIVGEKPTFFDWSNPRLVHLPCTDSYIRNKDGNLIRKVLLACKNGVSDEFVRMSDDQVFLKPTQATDIKPFYVQDLKIRTNFGNRFGRRLKHTRDTLISENKTCYHYESHYPMIYNRDKFIKVMNSYQHQDNESGFTINTLYFNNVLRDHEKIPLDYKLTVESPLVDLSRLSEVRFLGYNNKGVRDGLLCKALESIFTENSEVEV